MKQGNDESLTDMLARLADLLEVTDSCGASIIGYGVRNFIANRAEKKN